MPKSLILTLLEQQDEERALKQKLREVVMALASAVPWKFEHKVDRHFIESQRPPIISDGFMAENPDAKIEKLAVGIHQRRDWVDKSQTWAVLPKEIQVVYTYLKPHDWQKITDKEELALKNDIHEALKKFKPKLSGYGGIAILHAHKKLSKDLLERLSNYVYHIET